MVLPSSGPSLIPLLPLPHRSRASAASCTPSCSLSGEVKLTLRLALLLHLIIDVRRFTGRSEQGWLGRKRPRKSPELVGGLQVVDYRTVLLPHHRRHLRFLCTILRYELDRRRLWNEHRGGHSDDLHVLVRLHPRSHLVGTDLRDRWSTSRVHRNAILLCALRDWCVPSSPFSSSRSDRSSAGDGLGKNIETIVIMRLLAGTFAASPLTNCGGVIAGGLTLLAESIAETDLLAFPRYLGRCRPRQSNVGILSFRLCRPRNRVRRFPTSSGPSCAEQLLTTGSTDPSSAASSP